MDPVFAATLSALCVGLGFAGVKLKMFGYAYAMYGISVAVSTYLIVTTTKG